MCNDRKKHVTISNSRIKYSFDITRNITIISGDSATGKSILINMLEGFESEGKKSGVVLKSDAPCKVLTAANWEVNLSNIKSGIVFIDEGNDFVSSYDFASMIKKLIIIMFLLLVKICMIFLIVLVLFMSLLK